MYARVTQLEIDLLRTDIASALETFNSEVVPALEQQPDYAGAFVLVTPSGKGLITSFWRTAEAADAARDSGFYAEVLSRYVTLFRAPPGREQYEVVFADFPTLVEGS